MEQQAVHAAEGQAGKIMEQKHQSTWVTSED
jgi:hypothetical protein